MRLEHLYQVDLALLVVLQILLEEGSVTRAARRLGRSQPAISRALARLRDLFDDPLFTRDGGTLSPTPRAEALRGALEQTLSAIDSQLLSPARFDPATDHRTLRVVAADFAEAMLLPGPLASIARAAPHIDVELVANPRGWSMAQILRSGVHLAVSPMRLDDASIRSVHVGREHFACLLREGHPAADGLDLPTYAALPHLLVAPGGTAGGVVDTQLHALGLTRRVAVRTRHFLTAPELVRQSDLVVTLPRRFAAQQAARGGLVLRPPPLPLPPFDMRVAWQERWQHDPGHRWLRDHVATSLRAQLTEPSDVP